MIKITKKLYIAVVLMVVSIALMVTVSFAWFSLSTSPEIANIKIAIQGDNTIRIAPNVTETLNNQVINYPGGFDKTSKLDYTSDALLSPASTADGENWFVPKDYIEAEQKDIIGLEDFELDTELKYANSKDGGYIYLDFWVVSPLDNCILRVCSGDDDEAGSYAVQLPSAIKNINNDTGKSLDDSYQALSSSIRIGFLVNENIVVDNDIMNAYIHSEDYVNDFKSLRGNYDSDYRTRFLIYEPNGLAHSNEGKSVFIEDGNVEMVSIEDGEYHITKPIGFDDNDQISTVDINDRLVVQSRSSWKKMNESLILDDMYQAYLKSNVANKTMDNFYENYLQNTYSPYVEAGELFSSTRDLYTTGIDRVKHKEDLEKLGKTNAVTGSYVTVLKKNVPQRVRMFVWIEGQDIDCNYHAASQSLALRLELSGSSGI